MSSPCILAVSSLLNSMAGHARHDEIDWLDTLVTTSLTGSTRLTCRAHEFWLCRACRTVWLDMLDTTSLTGLTRLTCRAHAFLLRRACQTARLDKLVSMCLTRRTCRVETWRAKWVEFGLMHSNDWINHPRGCGSRNMQNNWRWHCQFKSSAAKCTHYKTLQSLITCNRAASAITTSNFDSIMSSRSMSL